MEFYGILNLNTSSLNNLTKCQFSPFSFGKLYRDCLSRNYDLLKKYSKNYKKMSYRIFKDKVKTIAYNQRKQLLHGSNIINIRNRRSSPALPTLQIDSQNNIRKKNSYLNSFRKNRNQNQWLSKQENNNACMRLSLKPKDMRLSLKPKHNFWIQKTRIKFPVAHKKQINVVWLGERELLNNEKIEKYLIDGHKFKLMRLKNKQSNSHQACKRVEYEKNSQSIRNNLQIQRNKYTINKFLKTESNKMYIPYFQM